MSDDKAPEDQQDEVVAEETVIDGEVNADGVSEEPVDEVDVLRGRVAELEEALLRKQADLENTRKRFRREADEAGGRAIVRFVRPLLTELDNFDRAIAHASPEQFQDFAMGVSMTKTNIDGVLSSQGIEPIACEGVFNPAVHEVVQEVEDAEVERGTIVQTLRTGYKLGDQVVRAAQVMVARPPAE
jgi:molecular chaperone GrpE